MARRRVAMVLNSPGLGGVPEVVRALVSRLPRDLYEPFVFLLKPGEREGVTALEDAGIAPIIADSGGGKTAVMAQLADWLDDQRIDILHTHSFRPNLYGRMAGAICRPSGLRMVSHYHNLYADKWQADPHALMLERRLAGATDAMIAVSDAVRGHLAKTTGLCRERITVMENGVDPARFDTASRAEGRRRLGLEQDEIAIGLVGRICRQKGQDVFLAAAQQLPELAKARFLMIGDAEDTALTATLRQQIAQAGLDHRIRLTGHMADAAPILAALDLLVMPSRWEGMPLVLLEAMAAGTPVIATPVGGVPEVVGDSGAACLVPPENAEAVAQAIRFLASDHRARAALVEAGRSRVARFSWDRTADRLAGLYAELLESPPR